MNFRQTEQSRRNYNHGGHCYRYASLFSWLARALGYDSHVVVGGIPSRSGGWADHGWTETFVNGQWLIFDTEMVHTYPYRNFYAMTYQTAPLN